jgi:hypothetical protein
MGFCTTGMLLFLIHNCDRMKKLPTITLPTASYQCMCSSETDTSLLKDINVHDVTCTNMYATYYEQSELATNSVKKILRPYIRSTIKCNNVSIH